MKKILLVNKSKEVIKTINKMILGKKYIIVATAYDGIEAINKHREFRPDITITGIDLPVVSGIEALRMFLQDREESKVVVCSRRNTRQDINNVIQLGAIGFIEKPFSADVLLKELDKSL